MPFWNCHFPSNIKYSVFILYRPAIGVRGGWRGGCSTPAWRISGIILLSGQAQVAHNSWMIKNISIQWKISGQLCFSAQAQVAQMLNDKKYAFSKWIQGTLFFRASASCSNPECKKYIQYSEKFQGKHKLLKSWMIKIFQYSEKFQVKSVFRASTSCSKILNDEKYLVNTVKNFRKISVFQGKCKLFKNAERWKNFQCSVFSVYSLGGGPCKLG